MFANSRPVESDQQGVHDNLNQMVQRHLDQPWRKPIAVHTMEAFRQAQQWREKLGAHAGVILDSGCGTGRSTIALAEQFPDALVIGIDQSAKRLTRTNEEGERPNNVLLLQAECADFWRLALQNQWQLERHYLLYPNPWPKAAHLKRRWHGHAVFPDMLKLGGVLELRSNWPIYLQEMHQALSLAGHVSRLEMGWQIAKPLSDFERKYLASEHALGRVICQL